VVDKVVDRGSLAAQLGVPEARELEGLGGRIRAARHKCGMTQGQIAMLSGVTLKAVGELERGEVKDPRTSSLVAVSKALNVSIMDLLEGPADPGKVEAPGKSGTRGPSDEGEVEEPSGDAVMTPLLRKVLRAPARDVEKNMQALNRLFAAEGEVPWTNASGFASDELRIELGERYGINDACFFEVIWPLAVLAGGSVGFVRDFALALSYEWKHDSASEEQAAADRTGNPGEGVA
jgi:transcriptional regulator with XRE-family HTH domain